MGLSSICLRSGLVFVNPSIDRLLVTHFRGLTAQPNVLGANDPIVELLPTPGPRCCYSECVFALLVRLKRGARCPAYGPIEGFDSMLVRLKEKMNGISVS